MSKVLKLLASPIIMAILLIAFGVSSAIATFVENDFGTQVARALIYNAWWFELIMVLLALNFFLMIFSRKLYRKDKLPLLLFHIAFIVILLGAGVTRYFGEEGMMHIREGQTVREFTSTESWLQVFIDQSVVYEKKVGFTPVTRNHFKTKIEHNDLKIDISLIEFIPHAVETVVEKPNGYPVLSLVIMDSTGNVSTLVHPNKIVPIGFTTIGFQQDDKQLDIELAVSDSGVVARSVHPVKIRQMEIDREITVMPNIWFKLNPQTFYNSDRINFAYRGFWPSASVAMRYNSDPQSFGRDVLLMQVDIGDDPKTIYVPFSNLNGTPVFEHFNDFRLGLKYGPRLKKIPFGVKLNDFVLERYPGSDSPSSFISNVEVVDSQLENPLSFSIYMNNILNYKGYRFYQSTYDPDERGTYLSVNNDLWGTRISYFGYFLLFVGMIWALLAPGTRFRQLVKKSAPVLILLVFAFSFSYGNTLSTPVPDAIHAREFGKLMVQDKGGRVKPLSTLSSEVLRKLNRSTKFNGQSPEQVYLGMTAFPDFWQHTPIITIRSEELAYLLGVGEGLASFVDFFDHNAGGNYKLSRLVQEAYAQKPVERTPFQKEIIKADERVNILYMVFSGRMARFFPLPNGVEGPWLSMAEAIEESDSTEVGKAAREFAHYLNSIRDASKSGNWSAIDKKLQDIKDYQQLMAGEVIPSSGRVKLEVLSNKLLIFERLIPFYGLIGLFMLILVFIDLFNRARMGDKIFIALSIALFAGFLAHTFAIGVRWYIAGRAPLSNAYESMVYVAWAAMLAGFIFANRSRVILPATALITTLTLFVAHLSWMDPEITNLVPVLKSYWLTIHVAVITASYGFFGLGAILALFCMLLFSFKTKNNKDLIDHQINTITIINELNLTLGIYLLTIGSFLGAVWANESWGRYWGWDPKETWALVTIIVYAFILHMRLIPSLKSWYAFNFGALFGLGSVLMTYFGVNYYLSGLHSYAGGDPLPIPSWIFFVVSALFSLSFFAWYNNRLANKVVNNEGDN